MGIKENFREFKRGLKNNYHNFITSPKRAHEKEISKHQEILENTIESQSYELSVRIEGTLAKLAVDLEDVGRRAQLTTELGRDMMHGTVYTSLDAATQSSDQYKEKWFREILPKVKSPEKRNDIRIKFLLDARNFWEEKLGNPDTPGEVNILGIRRRVQFDGELEALGYKPQDQ